MWVHIYSDYRFRSKGNLHASVQEGTTKLAVFVWVEVKCGAVEGLLRSGLWPLPHTQLRSSIIMTSSLDFYPHFPFTTLIIICTLLNKLHRTKRDASFDALITLTEPSTLQKDLHTDFLPNKH